MPESSWESLRLDFTQLRRECAINPPILTGGRLTAIWTAQVESEPARWRLNYHDGRDGAGIIERFGWLAECAAAKLAFAGSGYGSVSYWLDQLKRSAPKAYLGLPVTRAGGPDEVDQLYSVEILDICGLSASYCWKCEADEIRAQVRSASATARIDRGPARPEIQKFASAAFDVARDLIIGTYAEKEHSLELQSATKSNSGSYLPALVRLKAERVRESIVALADAYVEAFTLFGVPSDQQAETLLRTFAQQTVGGAIAAVRGLLQLRSGRKRAPIEGQGMPWHLEIEKSMDSALKQGLLMLRRQRIKCRASQGSPQASLASNRFDGTTKSRPAARVIADIKKSRKPQFPNRASWLRERLRERSWNKHDLARQRGPDHKTTQKILDGLSVREDVLDKVASALSTKRSKVTVLQIPVG